MMANRDTIIVGAGPTGASLAYLLAREGLNVVLVERETSFDRLFRGEGMMPTGIDALGQMGLRAEMERLPQRKLDTWKYFMNGVHLFTIPEPKRQTPNALRVMSQPHLLEMLVAKANGYPNFQFIPGFQVRDIVWQDGQVAGVTGRDEQGERQLSGNFVIGADGRASIIRTRAKLELDRSLEASPRNYDALWFSMPLPPWLEEETHWYGFAAEGTLATMYPSPLDDLRIGWLIPKSVQVDHRQVDIVAEVAARAPDYVAEHILAHKAQASPPAVFKVLFGRCPQWHKPGILLLGDAAHPMNPTRAQGINLGLRDAIVAANHLVPILKAGGTVAELNAAASRIQQEREPEIETAQRLQLEVSAPPAFFNWGWFRAAVLPLLRRLNIPQKMILRTERELREGITAVRLAI